MDLDSLPRYPGGPLKEYPEGYLITALSLNACPYLATSFFRYRPRVSDSIEATTILTQRGLVREWTEPLTENPSGKTKATRRWPESLRCWWVVSGSNTRPTD